MRKGCTVLLAVAALALPSAASAANTDWTTMRTMNMAHQGGEDEAPSATMYAFDRSMRLGADMLEVDVHTTADGHVVVMHDGAVDRTTNGTGSVYEMTLEQLREFDAAHWFVPGVGTTKDAPAADYAFRGARTGERPPPRGFEPEDFATPTLREVMEAYPEVPINIEIKGRSDADQQSFLDNADHLAALLKKLGRTDGIIVASFSDAAISRFQQLMPEIDLAPSIAETAAFKLGGVPPGPGKVAFQVPITLGGQSVTDPAFVDSAHEKGLAVHVWLSNDPENEAVYNQLLDWNVDAVMPAAPAAFERVLCEREVPRPPRPGGLPGKHCNQDRVSIACDVAAERISKVGGNRRVQVTLRRSDDFSGGCGGHLRLRLGGSTRDARFDFGHASVSDGGPGEVTVPMRLSKRMLGKLDRGPRRAKLRTRAYQAYGHVSKLSIAPK